MEEIVTIRLRTYPVYQEEYCLAEWYFSNGAESLQVVTINSEEYYLLKGHFDNETE